ncbi:hypothetical protein ACWJKU_10765 [Methylocaldum sp. MU1018]
MNALFNRALLVSIAMPVFAGCAALDAAGTGRPLAFHDTRLQYALLTDDRETLGKDFDMHTDPTFGERLVAGAVLPFDVAIETLFWPVSCAIASSLDEHDPRR